MSYKPPQTQSPEDILKRVARESETIASSSVSRVADESISKEKITATILASDTAKNMTQRLGNHFSGQDAFAENLGHDPAEVWGRRIGRTLSLIAFIALAYMLYVQMKM